MGECLCLYIYIYLCVCIPYILLNELVLFGFASVICFLQKGRTPLHLASNNGHVDAARHLLERGANVEAKDLVSVCVYKYIYIYI